MPATAIRDPVAPALGNEGTAIPPTVSRGRREGLWKALRALQRITTLHAVGRCRIAPVGEHVHIRETSPGRPRFSGLSTCGSVWACPICSTAIQAARTEELTHAIEAAHLRGIKVAALTLTMRHKSHHGLKRMWDALSPSWAAALTSDRAVRRAKKTAEVIGWVRIVEARHGRNGWHLHIHALVFFQEPEGLDALSDAIWQGWRRRLDRAGFRPSRERGIKLRELSLSQAREEVSSYHHKATWESSASTAGRAAAAELGGQAGKQGRDGRGSRSPFDLLRDVLASTGGDADDLALWREWEQASQRRRARTWSKGLRRELLGDDADPDDDDLAGDQETEPAAAGTVALLDRDTWTGLRAGGLDGQLLDAVADRGELAAFDAVGQFLAHHRLPPPIRPPQADPRPAKPDPGPP